jgi:hypothetical protein
MSTGVVFPNHYPPDCPPEAAEDAAGAVYRITKTDPPTQEDFLSFHELGMVLRKDTLSARCRSRGLSVYRTLGDARHHLSVFPNGGDYIAGGTLTSAQGQTQPTPASQRPTHTTWWCAEGIDRGERFVVIEGRDNVASEGD